MDDNSARSWKQWWATRPRRPQRWVYVDMSDEERQEFIAQRQRAYYATHTSARVARRTALGGLVVIVAGFFVSFSFNSAIAYLGNGLMVLGLATTVISYNFTSIARGLTAPLIVRKNPPKNPPPNRFRMDQMNKSDTSLHTK